MATMRVWVRSAVALIMLAGCHGDGVTVGGVVVGNGASGVSGGVGTGSGSGVVVGAGGSGVSYGLGLRTAGLSASLDRILAEDAARQALERAPSGTAKRWHNPENGHTGTFTPLDTYRSNDGLDCRNFQHEVIAGGRTETVRGAACRRPDGTWRDVTAR